ncbi:MAG: arylsulfatase [Verrucomicrobia bacterium]|nr:arylsulfatase [Verrucomicrobiota bacterium]
MLSFSTKMKRSRLFDCFAFIALILTVAPAVGAPRPNIVYILADDLGYGDLGSYGQQLIRTPRLDALAKQGMRFTQHYAGAPSCQPSRCVLLTGKHTGRARLRANSKLPLLPEDFTLSEMLQQAGYATGAVGKWGLGDRDTTGAPWKKGFDEFFGYLDQTHAHTYYPNHLWRNEKRVEIPENQNGKRAVYSHDLFAQAALDFIRRHKDKPFFFYGAFTIPHAEVTVPEDSLAEYRGKWPEPKKFEGSKTYCPQDQPRAVRAAMITRLDRDMGRILDLLDELKLAENTLVIFTSDNGPITAGGQDPEFFNSAGPLRGLKFTLYEGGIRVPFLARWPGKIAPGSMSDFASDFADMLPTFAELAGVKPPAGLDGVSIAPTLLGQNARQQRRAYHYWEAAPQQALRQGDWKAYRAAPGKPLELYNLASDISESRDLAKENPALASKMERLLQEARVESPEFPLAKKLKKKN